MPLSMAEILAAVESCPPQRPCPLPPPKDVCGFEKGYWIDVTPTSLNTLRVWPKGCGEYVENRLIEPCLFVDIWHMDAEGVPSTIVDGSSHPDCQPVPEPSFAVSLAIGAGTILLLSRRRT